MPSSPICKRLGAFMDALIGVAERAIELVGDPDFLRSVDRDRQALRHSHDHLVETLKELDSLQEENAQLRSWHERDSTEIMRLRTELDARQSEINVLEVLVRMWVPRDCMGATVVDPHGRGCLCPDCKGETDGNQSTRG